jgi:predicted O-methyltransferase YrrM
VLSDSAASTASQEIVGRLLNDVFPEGSGAEGAFTAAGMAVSELVSLHELVRTAGCDAALEIGMANATSSVVICAAMADRRNSRLISIDPYQSTEYKNQGLANIARAGFTGQHQLIEEPNYLALPRLLREGRRFGFIFIDGWHSFDHAMLDIFYADLLLNDGGVLALHDTDWPTVHKAVRFLETHKPYDRLSPAPAIALDRVTARIVRRVRTIVRGRGAVAQARARRTQWRSLSAYRKRRSETTPQRIAVRF